MPQPQAETPLPSERELILHAIAAVWSELGYEEMGLSQIAERSGVSGDVFAGLFTGKEAAATAVVDAVLAKTVTTVSDTYSADIPEWDSYMLAIRGILELMAAYPSTAFVAYIGSRQMGPPAVTKAHETGVQVLMVMIERLWEYSSSKVQPPGAARGALGGAEAVVRREITNGRVGELPRLLPDFVYAATVPFLGQEEALRLARRGRELLNGTAWGLKA